MPDLRTEITEVVTGLGMTGLDSVDSALAARPTSMGNVSDLVWDRLETAYGEPDHRSTFAGAWANGRAFFESADGLRGRVPLTIEWKGSHQLPGFDQLPVDLRVDHVYLISCKYQSKILANSSPSNLFQRRLADRTAGADTTSWYQRCAPAQYQHFYDCVRRYVGLALLPPTPQQLGRHEVARIRSACGGAWPDRLRSPWSELSTAVAEASAAQWASEIGTSARQEEMLWRLLRFGSSSYFLLGSSASGPIRLRIATPWDWRQGFSVRELEIGAVPGGQPKVSWAARALQRHDGSEREVRGHVEIRWAHGRYSSVEAKVYLDTPHHQVPGYHPLTQ